MEVQLRRLGPNSKIKILKVPKDCRSKIWLAGRGTSCQIYTKSQYASRQHFCIAYRDQKYFISDLQSANGTFVNDEKILCETLLTFGSIISVGVPSEMQDSLDCIVFIFELRSEVDSLEKQVNLNGNGDILEETAPPSITPVDVDLPTNHNNTINVEKTKDIIETLYNSSSSDIIVIEPLEEPKPPKIRKLNDIKTRKNINEDEDILAYEALTQVDEPVIKTEPDLLNYSLTEELIEINDSEDNLSPELKGDENKSPDADEDDDVVVLESVNKGNDWEVLDELTESDKKWMGRLLKVKKEEEFFKGDDGTKADEQVAVEKEQDSIAPCTVQLTRLSTNDREESILRATEGTFPRVKIPQTVTKKAVMKSVRFNLVPQIKYFERPSRPKLTASEKGRMRFTRIIYNICNWNSHWLEECKKVAPNKDPPDICEERLRKIPKKFPSHSDYMVAFIPVMLLQLWNKIKTNWINSGDSRFRQTVSCDAYDNFHTENLTVFHCTGLAQNVDAHKQLLREGHLVLLRLHQIQNPAITTPASEKYSKKLGYLVFGFVESRIYERFHDQPLHRSLAERCASIVGDLHIVRLRILVKKRPGFLVDKDKLIQLTVVQQILQEIKMFKAICFLPDSPLCKAVLKPPKNELSAVESVEKDNLVFKGPIDEFQSEIVRKLSRGISMTETLIFSVHGAAGTGKGQIIMALILQLLYSGLWKGSRPKILYCTRWSIPLDEMVLRLKNYRQNMDEPFSLVRVGQIWEVKPEVREFHLSTLAAERKKSDKKTCTAGRKVDAEVEVIKDADVICTTCASSGSTKMLAAFEKILANNRKRKIICILDKAMSCHEPDSVIPLLLGVTHLVLFGDIYQLEPMFSGEKTHSLGFDNSLFMRIYKNFEKVTPKDLWPIVILKTQYRMTPSLSKFTSQLIYDTYLQNPAFNVSNQMENIKYYLLLVYQTPGNLTKNEMCNRELRIVSQLVAAVKKITKTGARNSLKFAVITCDTKQRETLLYLLPKRLFPEVEIDSIQGFQGREFDAVVFVYDGRKIRMSWLSTALTRASSSLFICLSEQSIDGNPFFLKAADVAQSCGLLKYVHPDMRFKEWENILTNV